VGRVEAGQRGKSRSTSHKAEARDEVKGTKIATPRPYCTSIVMPSISFVLESIVREMSDGRIKKYSRQSSLRARRSVHVRFTRLGSWNIHVDLMWRDESGHCIALDIRICLSGTCAPQEKPGCVHAACIQYVDGCLPDSPDSESLGDIAIYDDLHHGKPMLMIDHLLHAT